jgi:hypothetical protein
LTPGHRTHRALLAATLAAVLAALPACADSSRDPLSLAAEPDSLAFDSLAVGRLSAPRVVVVSNGSADTVRLADLVVSGPAAGDFVLAEDLCGAATLAPGASCTVAVLFGPREPGLRRATLGVGPEAEAAVALTGTGGGMEGETASSGLVRAVPETLDFGEQPVGTPSGPLGVRLVNQRQGAVQFAVRIRDAGGAGYRIALDRCSNEILRPGRACTVQVLLDPGSEGLLTGELVLRDLNGRRDQAVPLSGIGIAAGSDIVIEGTTGSRLVSLPVSVRPPSLEFGVEAVGAASPPRIVTIENQGAGNVTFRSVEVAGDHAGDFRIARSDCGGGLVPTRACALEIVFEPSGPGLRTGRIEARTDGGIEPAMVLLSGTGESR